MRIIAHAKPAFWLVWIQVNDGRIQWSFWVTCPAFPGSQWPEAGVSSSVCKSKKSIFFPLLHFILSFQWMQWRNYTVKNVIMSYLPATAKYNWSKNWNEKKPEEFDWVYSIWCRKSYILSDGMFNQFWWNCLQLLCCTTSTHIFKSSWRFYIERS